MTLLRTCIRAVQISCTAPKKSGTPKTGVKTKASFQLRNNWKYCFLFFAT